MLSLDFSFLKHPVEIVHSLHQCQPLLNVIEALRIRAGRLLLGLAEQGARRPHCQRIPT